ncbi:hypothetical protein [Alkalicoccobacillus porphyridii]|uniref:Uncharacterized protein n=1 Tax=Alkalicoccobacillus porphyridii TaxID=2597270 RepID=A0A554A082_9BACI|nr:hypothetical protein [Alkalicoccobacillus porphyridii]TSB47100.1 hypothetical protein FN960_08785 [Alkalicoccobacillus porphyridii]
MYHIREKKEWMTKYINNNSLSGHVTALIELQQASDLSLEELFELLDELVENDIVQWTSEEHVISKPIPEWYTQRLKDISHIHEMALSIRYKA